MTNYETETRAGFEITGGIPEYMVRRFAMAQAAFNRGEVSHPQHWLRDNPIPSVAKREAQFDALEVRKRAMPPVKPDTDYFDEDTAFDMARKRVQLEYLARRAR